MIFFCLKKKKIIKNTLILGQSIIICKNLLTWIKDRNHKIEDKKGC